LSPSIWQPDFPGSDRIIATLHPGGLGHFRLGQEKVQTCCVLAVLKSLTTDIDGDPESFSGDLAQFGFFMEAEIGPAQGAGAELFGFTVCSPQWLEHRCAADGFIIGQHHVIVRVENYSNRALRTFLDHWVASVHGADWKELVNKLRGLGMWEFEDYVELPDRP
jgi:hypothetical protein